MEGDGAEGDEEILTKAAAGSRQTADASGRRSLLDALRPVSPNAIAIAIAAAAAALVVAKWSVGVQVSLEKGMNADDTLWYHMPFAARFVQDATITHLHFTDPRLLVWFYPENSELLHGAGILLFGLRDFLSPLINMGWLAVALLAAWCAGRPYGSGPAAASVIGVSIILTAGVLETQPGEAYNDVMALACLLASVAILLNRGPLLIAALAAGLALGTKLTVLAAVGALSIGVVVIAQRGMRLATAGIWATGLAATGAFWYVRNLIVVGNPLPFADVGPLPSPGVRLQQPAYAIWHYATDPEIWDRYFFPGFRAQLGDLWAPLLLLAAAAVVFALVRGTALQRMLGAVAAVATIAYVLTPLSAQGPPGMPVGFVTNVRYIAPAILLGLIVAVTIRPSEGPWRQRYEWLLLGVLAALFLIGERPFEGIASKRLAGALVAATLLVAFPVAVALARRRGLPVAAIAGATAAAVGLAIAGGYAVQRDYFRDRYQRSLEPYHLDSAYRWAEERSDRRIALAGTVAAFRQYGFYGEDLSNHVQYIGYRTRHSGYRFLRYCSRWKRAVNRGDYQYLVTTPFLAQSERRSGEQAWVRTDPGAVPIVRDGSVTLYRLNGDLDERLCARISEQNLSELGAVQ
jgi:hypothetical protein